MKRTIHAVAGNSESGGFSAREREILLGIARDSIEHGLARGKSLSLDPATFSAPLREKRATFVTLEREGRLRGCIGSLQARYSLVEDLAENAFSAAFRDPRFSPLVRAEWEEVSVKISLLTPATPMVFASEVDLIDQLRPGVDGLILTAGPRRATFLPAVWGSLTEPAEFLRHLKIKAGLAPGDWPSDVAVSRYGTEQIDESFESA
uniref:Uncharacterized protein, PH0010 family/AmmeMemoRadiSam system protein A n=1 Tax=Candidatus Kentrum sp. SD TaxID=2126332 RepID=A0A450Y9M0_9GAMM|nr:MAG: uncharacterized protein, PH0010 family/AmmeMemoRadiSam system protein A [Candidatus Kentron sp. SD]VFK42999.1 MAG: uncharacterized protein, PH0010 family/AmmeMemoRadiSam system protein A [Candidatus Kentron sp. SD]VFK78599.1 MAG: uncharacterized protein, PH0010 family/AmmeMemoRadiSam system protein A [Candidatus Kentron sp. SD]